MSLKEYLEKYNIHPVEMAVKCRVSPSSMYSYLNGSRPTKNIAIRIMQETKAEVKMEDLRGKDDKRK